MVKSMLITGLLIVSVAVSALRTAHAQFPFGVPVDLFVPLAPAPVRGDGKIHLVYELHITNFGLTEFTLKRIEALGQNKTTLAQFEGNELAQQISRPGAAQGDKLKLGPAMRAVVYMWVSVETEAAVPSILQHRITVTARAPSSDTASKEARPQSEAKAEGGETKVSREPILVIGPPLRGGEWLAANGPGNMSGHRRALIPLDGRVRVPQRFAIDWVQLGEDGKTWSGDQLKNESYRAYGAELLAVADGLVVDVKDGIPENIPGVTSRAVPITLETVGGNYVTLDLGKGRYAFYAHIQPRTIRVKVGDKARRGQVLGLLGNSGNSTEPHLHFHISDANSPLSSEGLPFVHDSFELQGRGWKAIEPGKPVEKRRLEIPLQNAVVRFP